MTTQSSTWRVPIALVALGTVPVIAGSLRLVELSGGAGAMPSDARYAASPLPVVLHIVCATVFTILGAFQFSPPSAGADQAGTGEPAGCWWIAGLGVALSALWLNEFFPRAGATREVLYPLRMVFGAAMVVTIVFGSSRPVVATSLVIGPDDPQLRDRHRRRYPGVHPGHRWSNLWHRGPDHRAPPGRRMGINLAVAERAIRKRPRRRMPASRSRWQRHD